MKKSFLLFGLVFIFLLSSAFATLPVSDTTGLSLTSSQTGGNSIGAVFDLNVESVYLNASYKVSSSTSTRCRVFYGNNYTLISTGTFSGNECVFSPAPILTNDNYYRIEFDDYGAGHTFYKYAGATFPYTGTNINFLTSSNGGFNLSTNYFEVNSITTTEILTPSQPFFEVTANDVDSGATLENITVSLANGTTYTNVSNSIVVTPFNDSRLLNFTVSVKNYFNQTFTNYNTSADLQANLTQYPLITAYDIWTEEPKGFNLTLTNGSTYETDEAGIYLPLNGSTTVYFTNPNYYPWNTTHNFAPPTGLNESLKRTKIFANFSNLVPLNGTNYTRQLSVSGNVTWCGQSTTMYILINDSVVGTESLPCERLAGGTSNVLDPATFNNAATFSFTYNPTSEGEFNLKLLINQSGNLIEPDETNQSFVADLFRPSVVVDTSSFEQGFTNDTNLAITLRCEDNIMPQLFYQLEVNGSDIILGNFTTNTTQSKNTGILDGTNEVTATCSDYFSQDEDVVTFLAYVKTFMLWDEIDDVAFDYTNVTYARLWFGDNSSFFDFQNESTWNVTAISTTTTNLRLELGYGTGDTIVRYVDVRYMPEDNPKLCANKEGVVHYEQLLFSATEKPAIMENYFVGCYVAADRTRFAYEDALSLRAFTINSDYDLKTYDEDGNQVTLASIDGRIGVNINLDALEFGLNAVSLNILQDQVAFQSLSNQSVKIYYKQNGGLNTGVLFQIFNADSGALLYEEDDFDDPNEITLYFDTTTVSGITNETLFKLQITKTTASGETFLTKYFNFQNGTGTIPGPVAAAIAIFLIFVALTSFATKSSFGIIGPLVLLVALVPLGFAIQYWYIIGLQALILIVMIFIVINLLTKTESKIV